MRAASVADRPSAAPPASGTFHFIADVREWRASYPWSIPLATANPDCHCAALGVEHASRSRFQLHTSSGAMAAAVEHFCWLLGCADRVAVEQPPTLLELVVRPPDVKTSVGHFGCARKKAWWWFLTNLPPVPPSHPDPPPDLPSEHHLHDSLPPELRSIARAATPPTLAAAHVKAWKPLLQEPRRAPPAAPGCQQGRARAAARRCTASPPRRVALRSATRG